MAVSPPLDGDQSPRPAPISRKRSHSSMVESKAPCKWIDEEIYRTTVLCLYSPKTESDIDKDLQTSARDLGLLPVDEPASLETLSSALSATTLTSENHQGSIMSQSTAPTSCASSEGRPSTSLSHKSSKTPTTIDLPAKATDMQTKRSSGFKSGLRKITSLGKKKTSPSSTTSTTSLNSHMTGTTADDSVQGLPKAAGSTKSGDSYPPQSPPRTKDDFEQEGFVDEVALQRTLDCDELIRTRSRQLEERRRFLEYQTRLVTELLQQRDRAKNVKREAYEEGVVDKEEQNEKAVEQFEARQLEEELKQQKEQELEKKAIQTRLKHMEAYCQTPSPPHTPTQNDFECRASEDSSRGLPGRHITQQHYESLAQAYHIRDNMDDLHTSKINVLRGKQRRALQNFMLKKERELEQLERQHQKELESIDADYARQEAELRREFDEKRKMLEARWQLQALVERTRMERSTGLKHEGLPNIAVEA